MICFKPVAFGIGKNIIMEFRCSGLTYIYSKVPSGLSIRVSFCSHYNAKNTLAIVLKLN